MPDFKVEYSVTENGRRAPEWTLESDLSGSQSLADFLQYTKNSLILIAGYALEEEQLKGFDKDPVVTVDGRKNRPVSEVSPLGNITFTSRSDIKDVVNGIYSFITDKSPYLTGRYSKSNYVLFNGSQIANDAATLAAWLATNPVVEPKDSIIFVNVQPYARKLERLGVTGQRTQHRIKKQKRADRQKINGGTLAPNGTYYLTTRAAARLYKNNVRVTFKYLPGSILGLKDNFKSAQNLTKRKFRKAVGRTYLYPSILLKVLDGGTINE